MRLNHKENGRRANRCDRPVVFVCPNFPSGGRAETFSRLGRLTPLSVERVFALLRICPFWAKNLGGTAEVFSSLFRDGSLIFVKGRNIMKEQLKAISEKATNVLKTLRLSPSLRSFAWLLGKKGELTEYLNKWANFRQKSVHYGTARQHSKSDIEAKLPKIRRNQKIEQAKKA